MEDIEDLVGLNVDVDVPRHRNSVMPRVRRRKKLLPASKEVRGRCHCIFSVGDYKEQECTSLLSDCSKINLQKH